MIIIVFILLLASLYGYRHFERERNVRRDRISGKRKADFKNLIDTLKEEKK